LRIHTAIADFPNPEANAKIVSENLFENRLLDLKEDLMEDMNILN